MVLLVKLSQTSLKVPRKQQFWASLNCNSFERLTGAFAFGAANID